MRRLLAALALSFCQPYPAPHPPPSGVSGATSTGGDPSWTPPMPPMGGGGFGGSAETGGTGGAVGACAAAYARASELGCPPLAPKGGTWIDACENARAHAADMGTSCAILAKDCVRISECFDSPR